MGHHRKTKSYRFHRAVKQKPAPTTELFNFFEVSLTALTSLFDRQKSFKKKHYRVYKYKPE
jgi:hypothetical protein